LRKIDDIEDQMSKQWWKAPAVAPASAAHSAAQSPNQYAGSDSFFDSKSAFPATVISPHWSQEVASAAPSNTSANLASEPVGTASTLDSSGFTASKLFAVELSDLLFDPDMEEAAIRFANGDDAGAQAVLQAGLRGLQAPDTSADVRATALFDLYRGTGRQADFERLALDYAQAFGRTAPIWFSTPDQLALPSQPVASKTRTNTDANPQVCWRCPAQLSSADVTRLQLSLKAAPSPWVLDWSELEEIAPQSAQALLTVFLQWSEESVVLHFVGTLVLDKLVRAATPTGVQSVAQFWWQLRFAMLRILGLQDDFEMAALDYCVTFEISPPAWKDPLCQPLYAAAAVAQTQQEPEVQAAQPAVQVELTGELQGDITAVLGVLEAAGLQTPYLVVSCARLIRVDFSAAGSILNWSANRQSLGCQIEFQDVPCLVAAFFNLIGINEHAKLSTRKN
jgi:ABC-type transporter Mla MlaB component